MNENIKRLTVKCIYTFFLKFNYLKLFFFWQVKILNFFLNVLKFFKGNIIIRFFKTVAAGVTHVNDL